MMSGNERLSSARIALAGILAVISWTLSLSGARAADLSDTTPPTLEAADSGFAPAAIDVTTAPATLAVP